MTAADRRLEIISILVVSGHTTSKELAQEFGVTRRTILHDVSVLSYGYPIYTKLGEFLSWTVINHIAIPSLPLSRKSSKKCMMRRRGRIKKFSNVSCGNTVHISWNCS